MSESIALRLRSRSIRMMSTWPRCSNETRSSAVSGMFESVILVLLVRVEMSFRPASLLSEAAGLFFVFSEQGERSRGPSGDHGFRFRIATGESVGQGHATHAGEDHVEHPGELRVGVDVIAKQSMCVFSHATQNGPFVFQQFGCQIWVSPSRDPGFCSRPKIWVKEAGP